LLPFELNSAATDRSDEAPNCNDCFGLLRGTTACGRLQPYRLTGSLSGSRRARIRNRARCRLSLCRSE